MLLRWVCCFVVGCFFSFSDARLIDSTVQQLAKTLKMPLYNGTDVAVIVRDLSSNTVLYEHNASRSFVPASLMKLVLTGAWLDNVRPSYQFKTPVYVDRQSPPSLYIKGVGDPNHRLDQFESLANRLKQLGITSLDEVILDTGNVIADQNKMKDYAQYYYALAAGLNFNFNQVSLRFSQNRSRLLVTPSSPFSMVDTTEATFLLPHERGFPHIRLVEQQGVDMYKIRGEVSELDGFYKQLTLRVSRPAYFYNTHLKQVKQ